MNKPIRKQIQIKGRVQGLGFRPFIYQLAKEHRLTGFVSNNLAGVDIEVQGYSVNVNHFIASIRSNAPALAKIKELNQNSLSAITQEQDFTIHQSPEQTGTVHVELLPDLAICQDCLQDISDPLSRFYQYPFTNCTFCGPRFSIIKALPYDRKRTSMASFPLCSDCQNDYQNPLNRRFHAQPIACVNCGPQLHLLSNTGEHLTHRSQALDQAVLALKAGKILALKGLGGFQLLVDATNSEAVKNLRTRKQRPTKALAVLFKDLQGVEVSCEVSTKARQLLTSYAAPIVLLPRKKNCPLSQEISPDTDQLGAFIAYTPLHWLLMQEMNRPLICTSGNLSSEPICIDETDALERLKTIADLFLSHNRPILRMVDDSVVQIIQVLEKNHQEKTQVIRRARGFAPETLQNHAELNPSKSLLALGGHLKNTFALSHRGEIIVSQFFGDLNHAKSRQHQRQNLQQLQSILAFKPDHILCDQHPDYASSLLAEEIAQQEGVPVSTVQHHQAHILAVMAEHGLSPPMLGMAWDGLGWGPDSTLWGGECLWVEKEGFSRWGHFRTFSLMGGEQCLKSPARQAFCLLAHILTPDELTHLDIPGLSSLSAQQRKWIIDNIKKKHLAQETSSVGRLFDVVAALLNLKHTVTFEAEAAMALEHCARQAWQLEEKPVYRFILKNTQPDDQPPQFIVDWEPVIRTILTDLQNQVPKSAIALAFHHALAEILTRLTQRLKVQSVILSGGCFQNSTLLELSLKHLHQAGLSCSFSEQFPANDGALALGQIWAGNYAI